MKVFITGISGLIGRALCLHFFSKGYQVAGLSRNPDKAWAKLKADCLELSSCAHGQLEKLSGKVQIIRHYNQLDNFNPNIVINLAGEPIADRRWSQQRKQQLRASRIDVTHDLLNWMSSLSKSPQLFISGSAVGFYGRQGGSWVTEQTKPFDEFSSRLCNDWENAAMSLSSSNELKDCRLCIMRMGIVIAKKGGFLGRLKLPFSLGLGGRLGKGEQYLSWIHLEDVVNAIQHLIDTESVSGVYNFTAPNPVTNRVFTQVMASTLSRPAFFHVPSFFLRLLLGELSDILLTGQRVSPKKLVDAGYQFKHERLEDALTHVLVKSARDAIED